MEARGRGREWIFFWQDSTTQCLYSQAWAAGIAYCVHGCCKGRGRLKIISPVTTLSVLYELCSVFYKMFMYTVQKYKEKGRTKIKI
jgi:hypothetical protein